MLGNADKAAPGSYSQRLRRRRRDSRAGGRHLRGARDGASPDRRPDRPRPRLCRGAERLRPPLHLLRHPLRPREFPLRRSGRGGRAGAPAGGARLSRGRGPPASTSPPGARTCRGRRRWGQLVGRILRLVPDLPRLRLSSIDAAEIDADLMRLLAEEPRLMPHLHLSLQAGDDMILKRMKRRHSRADALRLIEQVRAVRPDVAFGADLIAGFPTETEAMFEKHPVAGRGGWAVLPARLPLQPAPGHARRPHAAGGPRHGQGPRPAPARGGRPRPAPPSRPARSAARCRASWSARASPAPRISRRWCSKGRRSPAWSSHWRSRIMTAAERTAPWSDRSHIPVIPAKAGTQAFSRHFSIAAARTSALRNPIKNTWVPAFAGMTGVWG